LFCRSLLTFDVPRILLQMLDSERLQVKELKNQGYSGRQLQEMGYSECAIHTPPLALAKKY
jgi:hypothetical protein